MKKYDLIIIGAGPAGITAGIYAKNFDLDCLLIGENIGGLVNAAYKVENYPGIFSVSGKELFKKFKAHQKYLKVPLKKERVEKINPVIRPGRTTFKISTKKNYYYSKSVILAFGTESRKLNIKNIEKLEGRGVSYRVGDDTFLYKNKIVAIIGGANAAAMSAVSLSRSAKKVYLIYRREKLRADALWVDRVKKTKNIEVIYKANVICAEGRKSMEKIILDKNKKEIAVEGLFMETGIVPNTLLIRDLEIKTDRSGYIKVGSDQATNVPAVFAARDITMGSNNFRQIITACAEGAVAALSAFNYLRK